MDLGRIDSVTHVMALTIRNIGDETFGLAELTADDFNDIDVFHFVMSADIIYFTDSSLVDNKVDGTAVILYIEPVSNILALSVYGEGLVV